MLKYTVKRLIQSLVTIFLIATAVFLMMRCLPTDYYFTEEQLMKFTDQQKTAALEAAGLTDPIPTQLVKFYNSLLHLDFGTSRRIQNGAPVVKVIGKKFGVSMRLGLTASAISLVIGVLMGILPGITLIDAILHSCEPESGYYPGAPALSSIILACVITFCFSQLIQRLLVRKVRKIDMVEALKSVE